MPAQRTSAALLQSTLSVGPSAQVESAHQSTTCRQASAPSWRLVTQPLAPPPTPAPGAPPACSHPALFATCILLNSTRCLPFVPFSAPPIDFSPCISSRVRLPSACGPCPAVRPGLSLPPLRIFHPSDRSPFPPYPSPGPWPPMNAPQPPTPTPLRYYPSSPALFYLLSGFHPVCGACMSVPLRCVS